MKLTRDDRLFLASLALENEPIARYVAHVRTAVLATVRDVCDLWDAYLLRRLKLRAAHRRARAYAQRRRHRTRH